MSEHWPTPDRSAAASGPRSGLAARLLAWPRRALGAASLPPSYDPVAEATVAERLLPLAREVLFAPGAEEAEDALALVERLAPAGHTEVLCPPQVDAELVARLLGRQFVVYDAAAAPKRSVLVLDRRLGWRLPDWEPLAHAFQTTYRLLWTRLGYYTVLTGTVTQVHAAEHLFGLEGRKLWVNVAHRGLPLPESGAALRIVGMFSFVTAGFTLFHALRIEPLD